ncbi:hypothetical protein E4U26_008139 [Claviceps purpurea]|nr:hypothetical protein E4U26_008139 [Claviceps purpurea]
MKTRFVLGAASAVASIGAASRNLVATQSTATDTAPLPGLGASPPKITPPPGLDDIQKDLFKRDYDRVAPPVTVLLAPDNTCGWISGSSASPYLCNSDDTCCLILPPLTGPGFISCSNRGRRDVLYPQGEEMKPGSSTEGQAEGQARTADDVVLARDLPPQVNPALTASAKTPSEKH